MRIGLHLLNQPKEIADDWIWIIDHTVKIGCEKCFVILGVRQCNLPKRGKCITHKDLELIALLPVNKSNGDIVCKQLEKAAKITGEPRAILSDKGSDINAGVNKYIEKHVLVSPLYDISHKVACLLKKQLHENTRWNEFTAFANKMKSQLQQTPLAHLRPPKQRSKARYMNISPLVTWAQRGLILVTHPKQTDKCLKSKLGGIIEYKEEITIWSEMILVSEEVMHYMRTQYLEGNSKRRLKTYLKNTLPKLDTAMGEAMQRELLAFIGEQQTECYYENEKLPISSEVIESVFGKQKYIEGDQRGNGFTGLILAIGAIVSTLSDDIIKNALASVSTKNVIKWCKDNIGETVQSKRLGAFVELI